MEGSATTVVVSTPSLRRRRVSSSSTTGNAILTDLEVGGLPTILHLTTSDGRMPMPGPEGFTPAVPLPPSLGDPGSDEGAPGPAGASGAVPLASAAPSVSAGPTHTSIRASMRKARSMSSRAAPTNAPLSTHAGSSTSGAAPRFGRPTAPATPGGPLHPPRPSSAQSSAAASRGPSVPSSSSSLGSHAPSSPHVGSPVRKVVSRVHVEVGNGATGLLELRRGGDPGEYVQRFVASHPDAASRPCLRRDLEELAPSAKPDRPSLSARVKNALPPVFYTSLCLFGYGMSLWVNGLAGKLVGSQTPSQAILLLSAGRAVALTLVLPGLLLARWLAQRQRAAALGPALARPAPAPALSFATAVPALLAVTGNSAFLAYGSLVAGGGQVSIIAPLVGLYSLVPVLVGLTLRGEQRTWLKLVGIALSVAACLVLAFEGARAADGGGEAGVTSASIANKAGLFAAVFIAWGGGDALAAGVTLDAPTTALSSLVGQLACMAVYGFIAYTESIAPQVTHDTVPFGLPHLGVMGANALAVVGWLAFVRLGQLGQASAFVPVVSLYTFVAAILSLAVMGEAVTLGKVMGMLIAAVAIVLLSLSWAPKPSATSAAEEAATAGAAAACMVDAAPVGGAASESSTRSSALDTAPPHAVGLPSPAAPQPEGGVDPGPASAWTTTTSLSESATTTTSPRASACGASGSDAISGGSGEA